MAVKIRLKRMGKVRTPFYRIVVADSRRKRDGRVIEEIGTYNPKTDPSLIQVDSTRALHWLSVGAQPSEPVLALLRKTGDWQQFRGEPAPPPLLVAEARKDKSDVFNQLLQEAHGDPGAEAVTAKKPSRKTASAAERPAEQPVAEQPAAEQPTEQPAAEQPTEQPAAEQPTEQPAAEERPEPDERTDPASGGN